MSAGPTSSLIQEPEMAEQPTWPSRTIILGPTTLVIWVAQMAPPTLKTVATIIILPSLTNKPDARLKGTEKLRVHLEEELLSQTKTQPEIPVQSELPELALSP